MTDVNTSLLIREIYDKVTRLQKDVEALKKDSHPPIDLTPAIVDTLRALGYKPRANL